MPLLCFKHVTRTLPLAVVLGPLIGCAQGLIPTTAADSSAATSSTQVVNDLSFIANGPTTFAMVFRKNAIPHAARVLEDGQPVPTQIDPLAHWSDGSLKLARVTIMHKGTYEIVPTEHSARPAVPGPANIPIPQFQATATIDGIDYAMRLENMPHTVLAQGPLLVLYSFPATPLRSSKSDISHALSLRAWLWYYPKLDTAQIVATVENSWAQSADRNIPVQRLAFSIGQKTVYAQNGITIWRWSRTRPLRVWTHGTVNNHVVRNLAYLRSTGAVPNYDPALHISSATLRKLRAEYDKSPHGLMGHTILMPEMNATGGRPDIGPLPKWDIFPLLTNNPLALRLSLDIDDSSAVWPIHLRDKKTRRPLSTSEYPKATILEPILAKQLPGNPIPCWQHNCKAVYPKKHIPLRAQAAHEPGINYVPYLLTGDPYYLEEMQFWNNWNNLVRNPGYREGGKDIFLSGHYEVRAMAWHLRTLGFLEFVLNNGAPEKKHLEATIRNNLQVLLTKWVNGNIWPEHIITASTKGRTFHRSHGAMAPWQEDFLTWSIENMVRLGHSDWRPASRWISNFVVNRLTTPDVCPQFASLYNVKLYDRDGKAIGRWKAMISATAKDTHFPLKPRMLDLPCDSRALAKALRVPRPGDYAGYPWSPQGFVANMQPAIAAAVDAQAPGAVMAWEIYQKRPTKQDYSAYPNWDIVPTSQTTQQ